jgi:uncharacterized protein GlcG (DUF336 family)
MKETPMKLTSALFITGLSLSLSVGSAKAEDEGLFTSKSLTPETALTAALGNCRSQGFQVPGVLMIGGGMMIEAAGSLVGAIGVSGAPSGELDDSCAIAGIEAIEDLIGF